MTAGPAPGFRPCAAIALYTSVALLAALLVPLAHTPAAATTSPARPASDPPMLVELDASELPDPVPDGTEVSLTVHVLARAPIRTVEVYDGPDLITRRRAHGKTVARAVTWTAVGAGPHVLIARARDTRQRVGQSPPVWLEVATLAAVQSARISAGPGRARSAAFAAVNGPSATVDSGDCTVAVAVPAVQGKGGGSTVFAAAPGLSGFVAVGQVGPKGGTLHVPIGGSSYAFYSSSKNSPSPSPLVLVDGPTGCASAHWQGDVWIADGILHTKTPADVAYLYVARDGGPAIRVPSSDQTSVPAGPGGTTFDFTGQLPTMAGKKLAIEAWGRVGGGLVELGKGTLDTSEAGSKASANTMDLLVAPFMHSDLDWIKYVADPSTGEPEVLERYGVLEPWRWHQKTASSGGVSLNLTFSGVERFRWSSKHPEATHAVWQVSVLPPPSGPSLSYPGLIAFNAIDGSGGEFEIDFDAVLAGKGPKKLVPDSTLTYDELAPYALSPSVGGVANKRKPVVVGDQDVGKPKQLYVRVLPMKGTSPIDAPSNSVDFQVEWYDIAKIAKIIVDLSTNPAFDVSYSITAPTLPNEKYARCVRVVENPFDPDGYNPSPNGFFDQANYQPAPVGTTVCPAYNPPESSWWDFVTGAFEFVAGVWDKVSTFVNNLKNKVVSAFATYSGCSGVISASFCEKLIGTAIDIYLATNGIPPSFPSTAALKDAAKGQLADLAAQQVAQQCPAALESTCEEQAKEVAAELLDKIEEEVSHSAISAANSGDYDLYLNPAIKVIPEPAGLPQPSIVTINVTKNSPPYKATPPTACTFTAFSEGVNPAYSWYGKASQTSLPTHMTGTVVDHPLVGDTESVALGDLQPGETRTVVLSVGGLTEFWPPGTNPAVFGWWGQQPETGAFFLEGATIDIYWSSTQCKVGAKSSFAQHGNLSDTTPAEIPYP